MDMPLIRKLLAMSVHGADAVVPRHSDGNVEPLYAVYSRNLVPLINDMLAAGDRRVRSLFDRCKTQYFDLPEGYEILNINTPEDYKAYLSGRKP
jgi:molybdopterin-guanine dinucleotide biosynthesis protein A